MWAQRCAIRPRPIAPARSFPQTPGESISGAPTSQSHPTQPAFPTRSTGQAPALPRQGNPPPEVPRQAVRRQPAEDRLLRRQGEKTGSRAPTKFPDLREFPNRHKNRVVRPSKPRRRPSSHLIPPPPARSTPRSTSIRPTTGSSRASLTSIASSTPRPSPRSPSGASAPATTANETSSPWTSGRSR